MSPANVEYVKQNNPEIDNYRVEVCPNCIEVVDKSINAEERRSIRKKYDINIMAVKDDGKVSMAISADTCFKEDVTLLVLGEYKAIKKCFCI